MTDTSADTTTFTVNKITSLADLLLRANRKEDYRRVIIEIAERFNPTRFNFETSFSNARDWIEKFVGKDEEHCKMIVEKANSIIKNEERWQGQWLKEICGTSDVHQLKFNGILIEARNENSIFSHKKLLCEYGYYNSSIEYAIETTMKKYNYSRENAIARIVGDTWQAKYG